MEAFKRTRLPLPGGHAAELFDHVQAFAGPDFVPSRGEIAQFLRPGVIEDCIEIEGTRYIFTDPGPQRNEREKWLHQFDAVPAVVHVVRMASYAEDLYEDGEYKNGLEAALAGFEEVCGGLWLKQAAHVLVLTGQEELADTLERVPLERQYPEFADSKAEAEPLHRDVMAAHDFIAALFRRRFPQELQRLRVFWHSDSSAGHIFNQIKDITIEAALRAGGLLPDLEGTAGE